MEAQADPVAATMEALQQFDRMRRAGAEFLRQFVSRVAFRVQPDENRHRAGVDVERPHHACQLDDLVLVVERDHPDAERFKRQPDVRLRLDRVHVEHLGIGRDGAHRRELRWRSHVEGGYPGLRDGIEHHRLAIGLDRIGRLAGKQAGEAPRIGFQHFRPEAIDRPVRTKGQRGFTGGIESLHADSLLRSEAISEGPREKPVPENGWRGAFRSVSD
jgi:hypothetical protein